jgi:hypothetical protein
MFCLWLFFLIAFLLIPLWGVDSPPFLELFAGGAFLWIMSLIASLSFIGTGISFYDDKVISRLCWYFKKQILISDIDCYRIDPIRNLVLIVKGKPVRIYLNLPHTVSEAEEYLKSIGIRKEEKR